MSGKEYTHKDLSRLLGVSETTVKSYRRKFPDCIPVAGYGKPIRFGDDALRVARRIRDLFEYGLSVDETRARLAEEFDWIILPRADAGDRQPAPAEDAAPRPDPNTLLAGLARNMVDIFLGQKEIVKRLDHLTALLQTLPGASPAPEPSQGVVHKNASGIAPRQPAKGNGGHGSPEPAETSGYDPEQSAGSGGSYIPHGTEASGFDAERAPGSNGGYLPQGRDDASGPASERPGAPRGECGSPNARDARDAFDADPEGRGEPRAEHDPEARAAEHAGHACRILPLRRQDAPATAPDAGAARMPERSPVEPPRRFLALPLMAEAGNGGYIGAGGKRRGRFSLNDLKALLVFTFAPPSHFRFLWEEREDAWMLRLEQEQEKRRIDILLAERSLREGGTAAVILRLEDNGEERHPAEICAIIDAVGT
ncbi:MAG: MerR family transcriptional regulator [Desulfovibrio sp.]|jgi:hypothetical protein|nr:MerR family transcriptional regulator [Desulfovibrio sp.]